MLPGISNGTISKKFIIALDDEFDVVTLIEQSLQKLRYKVYYYTDPFIALEHFRLKLKYHCGMVISDISMPAMNGYEFTKNVKAIKPEVKIILMSAFEINHTELSTVLPSVKIDAFLQKPFSLRTLENLIVTKYPN